MSRPVPSRISFQPDEVPADSGEDMPISAARRASLKRNSHSSAMPRRSQGSYGSGQEEDGGGIFGVFRRLLWGDEGASHQKPADWAQRRLRGQNSDEEDYHLPGMGSPVHTGVNLRDSHGHLHMRSKHTGLGDRTLAPGEAALVAAQEAIRLATTTRPKPTVMHAGRAVPPIARKFEQAKEHMEAARTARLEKEAAENAAVPARTLADWMGAGLLLAHREGEVPRIEGSRRVPEGYEFAPWSTPAVPLLRHRLTGVVIWPIRLDLVPLYEFVDEFLGRGAHFGTRPTTTVYHYTSSHGFSRLVRPPSEHVAEAWEWAEELWERLEDDIEGHGVPSVPGAPEFSICLVSAEPKAFKRREDLSKAIFGGGEGAVAKVGYCIAFGVPTDHCLAVERNNSNPDSRAVIVLAPDAEVNDALGEGKDVKGNQPQLRAWGQVVLAAKKDEDTIAAKVRALGLLDGLIDAETGEPCSAAPEGDVLREGGRVTVLALADAAGAARNPPQAKAKARGRRRNSIIRDPEHSDSEEERLRSRLADLQEARIDVERKVQHAEREQVLMACGERHNILATDEHRLANLRRKLAKYDEKIAQVTEEIIKLEEEASVDSSRFSPMKRGPSSRMLRGPSRSTVPKGGPMKPEESGAGSDGKGGKDSPGSGGGSARVTNQRRGSVDGHRKKRRRAMKLALMRREKLQGTEFAADVKEAITDVGAEYAGMEGDMFREVFGGNLAGVQAWLEMGADPNQYHPETGWTPALMAASQGDPAMLELLVQGNANLSLASKEHGWTPVHLAAQKPTVEVLAYILDRNPTTAKERGKDGSSALLLAVLFAAPRARDAMVRMLLESGADANATRKDGWSPIAVAVTRNLRTATKLLLQYRAKIFEECPDTHPRITVWEAAAHHDGLQSLILSKLNTKDLHYIERRWPGQTRR